MAKPPLNGVAETEYTKSHLRGFSSLLKIFFPVSATPTNALRALVHSRDDLHGRGEHCSPAKNHKETFSFIALLSDQKRGKSHVRGLSSLLHISLRVHELVARAMRGKRGAAHGRAKVYSFALPAISIIPRVRTYHTKKPSRFVHALSARPLKVHGGRESNMCADGIKR